MGLNGPVALNDLALNNAMDNYFEVDKESRLELSLGARNLYLLILKAMKENEGS